MSYPKTDRVTSNDERIQPTTREFSPLVIKPPQGWSSLGLHDLWDNRELVYFMVIREIQGVYRQTALGISWLLIRPIINMVLLSLVFGALMKVPSDQIPYPLFSLSALIPWGYFSNAVMRTSRSLIDNTQVISKVYFPRLVLPLAAAISGLVDMGASFLVFFLAFFIYRMPLRIEMIWLPVMVLMSLMLALATGLWLATLSVKFRDVSFAINFLLQALMYASPVIYSASLVPGPLKFIYQLNPMTGIIQGFRWALLGSNEAPGVLFLLTVVETVIALISGAYIFRRTERNIVDLL